MEHSPMEYEVTGSEAGSRLDQFLARQQQARSRASIQKHIEAGAVLINGAPPRQGSKTKVSRGDRISYEPPPPQGSHVVPEKIPLSILFEDDHVLVIDKGRDLVVHPSSTRKTGTLVAAVLHHLGRAGGENPRPGIVHRLDKDTTGVMVVAKTPEAEDRLGASFRERNVDKEYLAVISGRPHPIEGTIRTLYGRHPRLRQRFSSRVLTGKVAITHFRVIETFVATSLVRVDLETGRTHQIRVHFADKGHPLVGDATYGRRHRSRDPRLADILADFSRPALHAHRLTFPHPATSEPMTFEAPIPDDLLHLIEELRDVH